MSANIPGGSLCPFPNLLHKNKSNPVVGLFQSVGGVIAFYLIRLKGIPWIGLRDAVDFFNPMKGASVGKITNRSTPTDRAVHHSSEPAPLSKQPAALQTDTHAVQVARDHSYGYPYRPNSPPEKPRSFVPAPLLVKQPATLMTATFTDFAGFF